MSVQVALKPGPRAEIDPGVHQAVEPAGRDERVLR